MKQLDKKTFHKKWYFRLFRIVVFCTFIFFIILGIWGIFYEDDMPLVAFFYAGVVTIVYWIIKKYLMHLGKINK